MRPAGTEARELRLVSRVLPDRRTLLAEAHALAAGIAAKSPLAVVGTKRVLLYQRCARCPCRAPVAARVLLRPRGDGCFMQCSVAPMPSAGLAVASLASAVCGPWVQGPQR